MCKPIMSLKNDSSMAKAKRESGASRRPVIDGPSIGSPRLKGYAFSTTTASVDIASSLAANPRR
jgi:hypothetical protein